MCTRVSSLGSYPPCVTHRYRFFIMAARLAGSLYSCTSRSATQRAYSGMSLIFRSVVHVTLSFPSSPLACCVVTLTNSAQFSQKFLHSCSHATNFRRSCTIFTRCCALSSRAFSRVLLVCFSCAFVCLTGALCCAAPELRVAAMKYAVAC